MPDKAGQTYRPPTDTLTELEGATVSHCYCERVTNSSGSRSVGQGEGRAWRGAEGLEQAQQQAGYRTGHDMP